MASNDAVELDTCTVRWDDDIDAVVTVWHDFPSGDGFREGMNTALEMMEERDASKSLSDSRAFTSLREEDERWIGESWTPRALNAGLEASAIVYAESVIAKMGLDKFAEEMEDVPMELMITEDVEEAREWLREQ